MCGAGCQRPNWICRLIITIIKIKIKKNYKKTIKKKCDAHSMISGCIIIPLKQALNENGWKRLEEESKLY